MSDIKETKNKEEKERFEKMSSKEKVAYYLGQLRKLREPIEKENNLSGE